MPQRYSHSSILGFARSQHHLVEAAPLDAQTVREDYFFSKHVQGPVHLIWRFNDDALNEHSNAPALAFQQCEAQPEDEEEMYALVYIDPSIEALWKERMDRE